uniref:small monomeric GTPase n=1 Tax=Oryzias sinensis TaxID=183150 RepID=A0A8C8A3N9_9TELE
MSMEDYDYLFKIVLIGNAGVGKTCLVRRFTQLQIWDTAGQERFRSITQSYYRSANALILTYDITCEDSFRCLPEWLREIEQYANNQVVTILVGKKQTLWSFENGFSHLLSKQKEISLLLSKTLTFLRKLPTYKSVLHPTHAGIHRHSHLLRLSHSHLFFFVLANCSHE